MQEKVISQPQENQQTIISGEKEKKQAVNQGSDLGLSSALGILTPEPSNGNEEQPIKRPKKRRNRSEDLGDNNINISIMNEYEEIEEAIDMYLMKRFMYRRSLVYLTPDNIITTRRNSRIDLYLHIRRLESLFPPDYLIIARIGFKKNASGMAPTSFSS